MSHTFPYHRSTKGTMEGREINAIGFVGSVTRASGARRAWRAFRSAPTCGSVWVGRFECGVADVVGGVAPEGGHRGGHWVSLGSKMKVGMLVLVLRLAWFCVRETLGWLFINIRSYITSYVTSDNYWPRDGAK